MRKIGKMNNIQLRGHQFKILAGVLGKAKNDKELIAVLNTILTVSEKSAIAQRTAIIKRIREGKPYFEIEAKFGASPSTISKAIDLYLKNGDNNKIFDDVLGRYNEPRFTYQISSKYKDRAASDMAVGLRGLQRLERTNYKRSRENSNKK